MREEPSSVTGDEPRLTVEREGAQFAPLEGVGDQGAHRSAPPVQVVADAEEDAECEERAERGRVGEHN